MLYKQLWPLNGHGVINWPASDSFFCYANSYYFKYWYRMLERYSQVWSSMIRVCFIGTQPSPTFVPIQHVQIKVSHSNY